MSVINSPYFIVYLAVLLFPINSQKLSMIYKYLVISTILPINVLKEKRKFMVNGLCINIRLKFVSVYNLLL